MASITNIYASETDLSRDIEQNGGKILYCVCTKFRSNFTVMAACNLRANDVARLVSEEDDFDESDENFLPCGDFINARGAEIVFPSEFLAPSSMPFLKTTVENLQPVLRDSILNNDDEFIEGLCVTSEQRSCSKSPHPPSTLDQSSEQCSHSKSLHPPSTLDQSSEQRSHSRSPQVLCYIVFLACLFC